MPNTNETSNGSLPFRTNVLDEVRGIVAQQLGLEAEAVQQQHHLENDLGCDSLDIVEITMEVEESFDISIPDEYGEKIRTIEQIVDGVLDLMGQSNAK